MIQPNASLKVYRQFNGCYTDEYEFMDCISTGQYKVINIDSLYEDFEEIFYSVFLKMAQMFCYYKVIIIVIIQLVASIKLPAHCAIL